MAGRQQAMASAERAARRVVAASTAMPLSLASLAGVLLLWPNDPAGLVLSGFAGLLALHAVLTSADDTSWWRAGLCGLCFGTAANAVALYSLVELLEQFAHLGPVAAHAVALLAWLSQALPFAVLGLLDALLRRAGVPVPCAFPLALVLALGSTPQLFPWHVGATLVGLLPLAQAAELGGEALLDLLLGSLVALTVAAARMRERRLLLLTAALGLLGASSGYGALRIEQVERARAKAPTIAVGVVQSNVGIDRKHHRAHAGEILTALRRSTRTLERAGADLTVWGETAYPYPLPRGQRRDPDDVRRVLGTGVRGPVLLGLETYEGDEAHERRYNTAWLVMQDGTLGERVDKAHLLPFGEYVPFWHFSPALRRRFKSPGFSAGEPGVLKTHGARLGVLICYEDLFASAARSTVARGAQALVNLTNDAWFGVSRAPALHDLLARLRAIEFRRDLVRAVNTGVSSFTSASGKSLVQTPLFVQARFVAQVRLLEQQTLFARWGDWVTPFALLISLLLCARAQLTETPPRPAA